MGTECSKLSPEHMEYLYRNTAFTRQQIDTWFGAFVTDCPKGYLTLEELKKMFRVQFPDGDSSKFAEHVFRTFDSNNDGVVDFKEFLYAVHVTSHGLLEEKLKFAFSMYDIDGNGYISFEEMLEIVRATYMAAGFMRLPTDVSTPEKRTINIFKQLNRKGDGRITFEEFEEGVKADESLLSLLLIKPLKMP